MPRFLDALLYHFRPRPPVRGTIGQQLAAVIKEAKGLQAAILHGDSHMTLSARATAIVNRLQVVANNAQSLISAEEASHDAANEAANSADDDAIEAAVTSVEGVLGLPASSETAAPIPAAD